MQILQHLIIMIEVEVTIACLHTLAEVVIGLVVGGAASGGEDGRGLEPLRPQIADKSAEFLILLQR